MKASKILLLVSACLCAAGVLIAGAGFALGGFDYHRLTTRKEGVDKTQSYSLEGVTEIRIDVRDQPVRLEHSPDGDFHVFYREEEGDRYTLEAEAGRISITHRGRSGFDSLFRGLFYNFYTGSREVTVQLPSDYAARLEVGTTNAAVKAADYPALTQADFHTSNAPVTLSRIGCTALEVSTTNAGMELTDIQAASAHISTTNSRLTLQNLQITGELNARTTNGSVTLEAADCGRAVLETSNGEVLLTNVKAGESLSARSSNAPIRLNTLESPVTTLKTTNGDVQGTVAGDPRTFYVRGRTSNGSNNLSENGDPSLPNRLVVTSSNADIKVNFI